MPKKRFSCGNCTTVDILASDPRIEFLNSNRPSNTLKTAPSDATTITDKAMIRTMCRADSLITIKSLYAYINIRKIKTKGKSEWDCRLANREAAVDKIKVIREVLSATNINMP
jgi:hypothetical protein